MRCKAGAFQGLARDAKANDEKGLASLLGSSRCRLVMLNTVDGINYSWESRWPMCRSRPRTERLLSPGFQAFLTRNACFFIPLSQHPLEFTTRCRPTMFTSDKSVIRIHDTHDGKEAANTGKQREDFTSAHQHSFQSQVPPLLQEFQT